MENETFVIPLKFAEINDEPAAMLFACSETMPETTAILFGF
jgi:hypothetical protein